MVNLEKHIEKLMLYNDCVIIPGFGGFVAHHVSASYDATRGVFLPPRRMIGFNQQLKINDSLLAQSYIETYQMSYPDAIRQIERETDEMRQILSEKDNYLFPGIGELTLNTEGHIEFKPFDAGLMTPELYGFGRVEISKLHRQAKAETLITNDDFADESEKKKEKTITIKVTTLRNTVAACAAAVALVIMPMQLHRFGDHINVASPFSGMSLLKKMMPKSVVTNDVMSKDNKLVTPKTYIPKTKAQLQKESMATESSEPANVAPSQSVKQEAGKYCIVLASRVSKKNAEAFVQSLHGNGFKAARVLDGKNIKVVYGAYQDKTAAQEALRNLSTNKDFKDGWVMELGGE